jgi:hypothetical protein
MTSLLNFIKISISWFKSLWGETDRDRKVISLLFSFSKESRIKKHAADPMSK